MHPPIVTVSINTYNHEDFIERTLDGVFRQKTSFPFEVIICNDGSTDNTHEIVKKHIKDLPNITYIVQDKNVGISQNFMDTLTNAKGKYVAVLDGDDYWVDDHKLQDQVDFLETFTQIVACFTDTYLHTADGLSNIGVLKNKHKRNISLETLEEGGFWIPTSTFMYKRSSLKMPLPAIYAQITMVDEFLFYLILSNGQIGYLDKVTAAYRKHNSGIWTGLDEINKLEFRISNFSKMKDYFSDNSILHDRFKKAVAGNQKELRKKKMRDLRKNWQKLFS